MQTTSSAQDREVRIARSSGLVRAIDDVRWVRIHGLLRALFADKVFETAAAPQYLKISVLAEEAHPRSVRIFSNALIFSNTGHTVLHSAVLVRKPTLLARLAPLIATATQHDRETLWKSPGRSRL